MTSPYFSRAFLDACDEKDLAILRLELGKHPADAAHLAEVEAEIKKRGSGEEIAARLNRKIADDAQWPEERTGA